MKKDKKAFKKEGEELQKFLAFRRKAGVVPSKKEYNRRKFKKGLDD